MKHISAIIGNIGYKCNWQLKFAWFPVKTKSQKFVWLKKYYKCYMSYDWPPGKVQSDTITYHTYNEGLVAMLEA